MNLRLGVHVGQQNMSMASLRQLWRKLDGQVDWISAWDHFYEAPPAGGTIDHFEAMTTLGALAADKGGGAAAARLVPLVVGEAGKNGSLASPNCSYLPKIPRIFLLLM